MLTTQGESWLKQRTLTTKLIDHREHPKRLAVEHLIMNEVHTPALVRSLGLRHRSTMQAHVLATTHPHADLQDFLPIPSIHTLLVHRPSLTAQHDVNP